MNINRIIQGVQGMFSAKGADETNVEEIVKLDPSKLSVDQHCLIIRNLNDETIRRYFEENIDNKTILNDNFYSALKCLIDENMKYEDIDTECEYRINSYFKIIIDILRRYCDERNKCMTLIHSFLFSLEDRKLGKERETFEKEGKNIGELIYSNYHDKNYQEKMVKYCEEVLNLDFDYADIRSIFYFYLKIITDFKDDQINLRFGYYQNFLDNSFRAAAPGMVSIAERVVKLQNMIKKEDEKFFDIKRNNAKVEDCSLDMISENETRKSTAVNIDIDEEIAKLDPRSLTVKQYCTIIKKLDNKKLKEYFEKIINNKLFCENFYSAFKIEIGKNIYSSEKINLYFNIIMSILNTYYSEKKSCISVMETLLNSLHNIVKIHYNKRDILIEYCEKVLELDFDYDEIRYVFFIYIENIRNSTKCAQSSFKYYLEYLYNWENGDNASTAPGSRFVEKIVKMQIEKMKNEGYMRQGDSCIIPIDIDKILP